MTACYFCDETACLEEHHIVPRRFGGSDDSANLVRVCPTCHRKLESLYDKRFYDQLGVDSSPKTAEPQRCARQRCHALTDHRVTNDAGMARYLCETHAVCEYWAQRGGRDSCSQTATTVIRSNAHRSSDRIAVCSKHRICSAEGCGSRDVREVAFPWDSLNAVFPLVLCLNHAVEKAEHYDITEDEVERLFKQSSQPTAT